MTKYVLGLVGVIILGVVVGYFVYNKPHEDIGKAQPDYRLQSAELFTAFDTNEAKANEKYLDKVLEITGTVTSSSIDEEGISTVTLAGGGMMFGVICKLDALAEHKRLEFTAGEEVTLRGVCSGMLMDVVLVRCIEV